MPQRCLLVQRHILKLKLPWRWQTYWHHGDDDDDDNDDDDDENSDDDDDKNVPCKD